MKKMLSFFVTFVLLLSYSFNVYASQNAVVEGKEITLGYGEEVIIPVSIDNNSGIMGFKIMLDYDSSVLSIKNISAGAITGGGNFAQNAGLKDGHVDIVWNSTSNVSGAGTIFSIDVVAIGKTANKSEIEISYSQEDTFDEQYNDVKLNCKNIIIAFNGETTDSSITVEDNQSPIPLESAQIVDIINVILNQTGTENLSNIKNEKEFVEEFNEKVEIYTGTNIYAVSSLSQIKDLYDNAYKDVVASSISTNVNNDDIRTIVENTLSQLGVSSIEELNDNQKKEFVESIEKSLAEKYESAPELLEKLDTDTALEVISDIYDDSFAITEEQTSQMNGSQSNETNDKDNSRMKVIIVIVALVGICFIVGTIIFIVSKRKKEIKK